MSGTEARYVPAAGWHAFTRLYDPVLAITMREQRWRGQLADLIDADLPDGGTVLDVGCGTGTFAIAVAARRPDAQLVGVDGDPAILELARRKQGADAIEWLEGLAGDLPLPDAGTDAVATSLMLHHLLPADKHTALTEARRVLKPGGQLYVVDWGRPADPLMRGAFWLLGLVDGREQTRDHAAGRLPQIITGAGFEGVACRARLRTAFGSLEILTARSNQTKTELDERCRRRAG